MTALERRKFIGFVSAPFVGPLTVFIAKRQVEAAQGRTDRPPKKSPRNALTREVVVFAQGN